MNLGLVLRKTRKHAGLSQEELAEELYLPRSTISKLENNKVALRAEDLIKWCNITKAQEVLIALLYGIDSTTIVENITKLLGGFITWI